MQEAEKFKKILAKAAESDNTVRTKFQTNKGGHLKCEIHCFSFLVDQDGINALGQSVEALSQMIPSAQVNAAGQST